MRQGRGGVCVCVERRISRARRVSVLDYFYSSLSPNTEKRVAQVDGCGGARCVCVCVCACVCGVCVWCVGNEEGEVHACVCVWGV